MPYQSESGRFRIAMGGDCMLTRRLSVFDEPEFLAVRKIFTDSDAGFVNFESVCRHPSEGVPGITRGTYMTTPPALLADLKWFGVNIVNCANNHAFDYGEGGLLATMAHLKAAGIAYAGAGRNLDEARRAGYLDTKGGRVALLGTTATYRPWNAAGPQRPDMLGRPGINPFGSSTTYTVDKETFAALRRMSEGLGFEQSRNRDRTHFFSEKEAPADKADELRLFGERVVSGKGFTSVAVGETDDIEDNLRWIRDARRQADWVVVSFHSHDFAQASLKSAKTKIELKEPADYIPAYARAAIDAGADIFVGHGSHTPLGIEIYKGKPILYSVGNFIFQNETVEGFPAEAYGRFGLGHANTPMDFLDARTGGGTKGHVAHEGFWENIAITCQFDRHKLAEIRVHPVTQGFGTSRSERGRPLLASGTAAERVIKRVAELSKPYGVTIKTIDGIGVVKL